VPSVKDDSCPARTVSSPGSAPPVITGDLYDRLALGHLPGAWTPVPAPVARESYDQWQQSLPIAEDIPLGVVLIAGVPPLEAVTDTSPPTTGWADVTPLTADQLRQVGQDNLDCFADLVPLTLEQLKENCE
jgi:hypothetical protein